MNDPSSSNDAATAPARPERVRVTAPRAGEPLHSTTDALEVADAERVIVDGLIRSQLRLAVLCAAGFIIILVVIAIVGSLPALDELRVAGVPASWLVLAFGAYPPLVVIAAIAVLAASRTETQFRLLAHRSENEASPR